MFMKLVMFLKPLALRLASWIFELIPSRTPLLMREEM